MKKKITCIECPKGCLLSVDIENRRVVEVGGAECPKGEKYAVSEIENPLRILTSTVLSEGLSLRMIPVRTDRPMPKPDILRGAEEIRKIRIGGPVNAGDVIVKDFLGLDVNLVATRGSS